MPKGILVVVAAAVRLECSETNHAPLTEDCSCCFPGDVGLQQSRNVFCRPLITLIKCLSCSRRVKVDTSHIYVCMYNRIGCIHTVESNAAGVSSNPHRMNDPSIMMVLL